MSVLKPVKILDVNIECFGSNGEDRQRFLRDDDRPDTWLFSNQLLHSTVTGWVLCTVAEIFALIQLVLDMKKNQLNSWLFLLFIDTEERCMKVTELWFNRHCSTFTE